MTTQGSLDLAVSRPLEALWPFTCWVCGEDRDPGDDVQFVFCEGEKIETGCLPALSQMQDTVDHADRHRAALSLWEGGACLDEIAAALTTDRYSAQRLVGAANRDRVVPRGPAERRRRIAEAMMEAGATLEEVVAGLGSPKRP